MQSGLNITKVWSIRLISSVLINDIFTLIESISARSLRFFLYRSQGEFSSPSCHKQSPKTLRRHWMALIQALNPPSLSAIHFTFTPKGQRQNVESAPAPCWNMVVDIAKFFLHSFGCKVWQARSSSCCSRELHSRYPATNSEPMCGWRVPWWLTGSRTETLARTNPRAG